MGIRLGKALVRPGAALLLAALLFDQALALPLLIAVFSHELGHIAGLRLCGADIERLELGAGGLAAIYDSRRLSYGREMLCAALGPAASLLLAMAASAFGSFLSFEPAFITAGSSLALLLFNLLPVSVLDGGRILWLLTAKKLGPDPADRFFNIWDMAVSCGLFVVSTILAATKRANVTMLLISAVLVIFCCKSRKNSVIF